MNKDLLNFTTKDFNDRGIKDILHCEREPFGDVFYISWIYKKKRNAGIIIYNFISNEVEGNTSII